MSEKRKLTVPSGRSPEVITLTKLTTARPLPAAEIGDFRIESGGLAGRSKERGSQRGWVDVESAEHRGGAIGALAGGQGKSEVLDSDVPMAEIQRRPKRAFEDVLRPAGERKMPASLTLRRPGHFDQCRIQPDRHERVLIHAVELGTNDSDIRKHICDSRRASHPNEEMLGADAGVASGLCLFYGMCHYEPSFLGESLEQPLPPMFLVRRLT